LAVRALCWIGDFFLLRDGWIGDWTGKEEEGRCVRGLHEDQPAVVGPGGVRTVRSGYGWRREDRDQLSPDLSNGPGLEKLLGPWISSLAKDQFGQAR
jgi:hypothetical protein